MKYATLFTLLSLLTALYAVEIGSLGFLLLWPALSFGLVGAAYAGAGPGLFGKNRRGTIRLPNRLLLFPFLMYTSVLWHTIRRLSRENAFDVIDEGLLQGRRLLPNELPTDLELILDLTAEFAEPSPIRNHVGYRSLPILDASAPHRLDQFDSLVEEAALTKGRVFIHCAQGHGRSGLFVAAVLLRRALASSPEEAVEKIRASRPRADLSRLQMAFLKAYHTRSITPRAKSCHQVDLHA